MSLEEANTEGISSALQDNINRKGTNSYYYAHGNKINGPEWDGNEEPRLISQTSIDSTSSKSNFVVKPIDDYYWTDNDSNIKIYIDWDTDKVEDDDINISSTSSSLDFSIKSQGEIRSLVVSNLHESIDNASYKKKTGKFIITLQKSVESTWASLKK